MTIQLGGIVDFETILMSSHESASGVISARFFSEGKETATTARFGFLDYSANVVLVVID